METVAKVEYDLIARRLADEWSIEEAEETHGE